MMNLPGSLVPSLKNWEEPEHEARISMGQDLNPTAPDVTFLLSFRLCVTYYYYRVFVSETPVKVDAH